MDIEAPDPCPKCGSLDLEVIRATHNNVTLRCEECGDVHRASPRRLRSRIVPLIVSHGDESTRTSLEVVTADDVRVGDEFEQDGHRFMVTAIDVAGKQVPKAKAGDVKVLYAKTFDQVNLKLSVNEGETTSSYQMPVEPEFRVAIGDVIEVQGRTLAVKTLKSDQNRTLHKGFLLARNVRRAFCDPVEGKRAGDKVVTRRRGAPAGVKGKPRRGPQRS